MMMMEFIQMKLIESRRSLEYLHLTPLDGQWRSDDLVGRFYGVRKVCRIWPDLPDEPRYTEQLERPTLAKTLPLTIANGTGP
jgi:hypothetical protein